MLPTADVYFSTANATVSGETRGEVGEGWRHRGRLLRCHPRVSDCWGYFLWIRKSCIWLFRCPMPPLDNVAEHRCSSWLGTRPRTWGSEGSRRAIYSLPSGYIWHCERHRGSLHVCSTIIFYILPCLILTPAEETRSWTNSSEEPSLVVGWVWIVVKTNIIMEVSMLLWKENLC